MYTTAFITSFLFLGGYAKARQLSRETTTTIKLEDTVVELNYANNNINKRVAAIFDVDGTLYRVPGDSTGAATAVVTLFWITRASSLIKFSMVVFCIPILLVVLYILDKIDRTMSLFLMSNLQFVGVKTITYKDLRWKRRDIKTVNLLPNIIAANMAKKKNAYEAILIQNGKVTEGTSSNIWIIKRNNLITHPANSDILKGVTRTSLLKIIKKTSLKLIEKQFTHKQLINADEVFLTSSGSFITPILKIDNKKINNGKIGNITLKLAEMYTEACING